MSETPQQPAPERSTFEPWSFLWRRKLLILTTTLTAAAAALLYTLATREDQYTSEATTVASAPRIDERVLSQGNGGTPPVDLLSRLETDLQIASLDPVVERTNEQLGGDTAGGVEVSRELGSNLLRFEATGTDPVRVAELANAFAENYIELQREIDRTALAEAGRQVRADLASLSAEERAGAVGSALRQQAARVGALQALQTGGAQIADPAEVATTPDQSATAAAVRSTVLGGFLGLLLGVGLALGIDRADPRAKSLRDLRAAAELRLLGSIPSGRKPLDRGGGLDRLSEDRAEAFRLLRRHVRLAAGPEGERQSLMVTSPSAGDGKSTVAYFLALAAAEAGERALLVEGDLRRPSLAAEIGAPALPGLAEVLAGKAELDAALFSAAGAGGTALDVIVAGRPESRTVQLLESRRARQLFEGIGDEYDFLVIDAPSITSSADAAALTGLVASVILVGRVGNTSASGLASAADQLQALGTPLLGLVANATSAGEHGSPGSSRSSDGPALITRVLGS